MQHVVPMDGKINILEFGQINMVIHCILQHVWIGMGRFIC